MNKDTETFVRLKYLMIDFIGTTIGVFIFLSIIVGLVYGLFYILLLTPTLGFWVIPLLMSYLSVIIAVARLN
jgi:hypothetical protein